MLRVKQGQGQQRYYPAVLAANGTVKPFYAQIAGKAECREDGVYYLRYTDSGKKRHYQYVGTDPKLARTMQLQRQHVIAGEKIGLETVEPPPAPKPIKIIPIGPPSVAPLVNPLASPPDPFSKRLPLAATIDQWDTDPWQLNTPQGVIDLTTGQSRPHIPEDYITKITAVAPKGDCPRPRLP